MDEPPNNEPEDDEPSFAIDREASYVCDRCGEEIVVPIDVTAGFEQEYVEDCPVCCHPNVLRLHLRDDDVAIDADLE
jgi:DNA-directed RNA polymerase subunit RPC12/RpoP